MNEGRDERFLTESEAWCEEAEEARRNSVGAAMMIVQDSHEAEDTAQKVLLASWQKREK